MAKFSEEGLNPIIIKRTLAFLNRVKDAKTLIEQAPKKTDDPTDYWVGETVASRIMSKRNAIPGRRLSNLSQLSDIQGFGQDKFDELIAMFQVAPSEAFRLSMYNGVIMENWILKHDTTTITDETEFNNIADNECNLRKYVGQQLKRICLERFQNQQAAQLAPRTLVSKYLERFDDAHLGSFALAFWFYRIDMDNWFSYERVRLECESYLSTFLNYSSRMELCFFKGFNSVKVLNDPLTAKDLPVVLNYEEQSISIWSVQLND